MLFICADVNIEQGLNGPVFTAKPIWAKSEEKKTHLEKL